MQAVFYVNAEYIMYNRQSGLTRAVEPWAHRYFPIKTNNNKKNFSYKIIYNTTDGVHWDKDTTNTYVDMMLNLSGDLQIKKKIQYF